MYGHAKISQFEMLTLFGFTKSTWVSKNIIFKYIRMTRFISLVQYRVKGKRVIIHIIVITKKIVSNLITFSALE